MDKICEDTGIAATVGGSASIIGGVLGVAGLLGAPFTAGLSLSLSVVGAGVCSCR